MIDHLGLTVSDFAAARRFYDAALQPLGIAVAMEVSAERTGGDPYVGYGKDRPLFWIGTGGPATGPIHLALEAPSRTLVDAFHAAAIAAGGRDNGPPGLRPHYHPNYYAAFVIGPDGVNLEAVCHAPA